MKILHITPAFYPAIYWGGPIYSVYGLCNALAKMPGIKLRVLTTDTAGPNRSDSVTVTGFPMIYPPGYEVFFFHRLFAASVSPGMLMRLWSMIQWADVVHLTAVYSPPTFPTLLICCVLGKPLVWSPRGALQRWEGATRPLMKRAWEGICNILIRHNSCVMHVTSSEEAVNSEARIPNGRPVIIPNGVDIPEALPPREWLPGGRLRLLYLGRLHPIKGIENLLLALRALQDATISLVICGKGDAKYSLNLRKLANQLGLERSVSFKGPVDGKDKLSAFMQADVCVVPSFTENFGMVVAEALAHGVPVIASRGTPWSELNKRGCGLWADNSPDSLAAAVSAIRVADLMRMGVSGRAWMRDGYDWEAIAVQMLQCYGAIL